LSTIHPRHPSLYLATLLKNPCRKRTLDSYMSMDATAERSADKVAITVQPEVLAETIMCPSEFTCLKNGQCGDHPMCEVKEADGKNVLVLMRKGKSICPYQVSFGYSQFCTCPTHYAINLRKRQVALV